MAVPAPVSSRVTWSVKPVSFTLLASRASTTGSVVKSRTDPLVPVNGEGWVENTSLVATTSAVTALAFTVDRLVPTPSSSLAVRVKLCWSAVAV